MSVFDTGIDTLFAVHPSAVDAVFTPAGGVGTAVRAIRVQPQDVVTGIAGLEIVSSGDVFDVRQSEVPNPSRDDMLTVDSVDYLVQSAPRLDQIRKTWRLDVSKRP